MRNAAKDLCDDQYATGIQDPTWTQWINDGIERLYRIIAKVGTGAFQTSSLVTLTAASNLIPNPTGMRRLLGVSRDPGVPAQRRSLRKYNEGERDGLGLLGPLGYRVVGQSIQIEPFQLCAGNYGVYYVAGPTVLTLDTDLIDSILEPFDDYATTWAATKALGHEESDNRDMYTDLAAIGQDAAEMFMGNDGEDASTIVDDENRGPTIWTVP